MKIKRIELIDILQFLGDAIVNVIGDTTGAYIDNLADMARINEHSLDWINPTKENKQRMPALRCWDRLLQPLRVQAN